MAGKIWILLCALGLVCSCNEEEDVPVAVEDAIAPCFVVQKPYSDHPDTRAADTVWSANDEIGIYMLGKSGDSFDYVLANALYKNRMYTVSNAANGTLTPAAGHTMYYPVNGDPVRFVAYYPYSISADDNANALFFDFAGQSTPRLKELKDFVFHRGTTEYHKLNRNVELSFKHKFSKIRITVNRVVGGPSLKHLKMTLMNMPESALVDLAALASDDTETSVEPLGISTTATDITPCMVYNTITQEATLEAIVAPHTGTDFPGRQFKFTVEGKEYTSPPLPDDVDFESGEEYDFAFALMPQEIQTGTSDELANCYMVAPGGQVEIPITRAITVGGMDASAAATLDVLWDDNSVVSLSGLTGDGADRRFTVYATDDTKQGNAVVALKSSDGMTIYWSWHIWVCNYRHKTWTNPNSQTYTFMDRNLGATEAANSLAGRGLFYQWGRKDPFPGGEGMAGWNQLSVFKGIPEAGSAEPVYVTNTNMNNTGITAGILESIRKPTTFFAHRNETYLDWLPKNENTLWNTTAGKKSVYDPCPIGWRVPVRKDGTVSDTNTNNSPWKGCTNISSWIPSDTGGMNFGTNALYPASGFRYYIQRDFSHGGSSGDYWCASVNNYTGYYLLFNNDNSYDPNCRTKRACGFSVRCVQEYPIEP